MPRVMHSDTPLIASSRCSDSDVTAGSRDETEADTEQQRSERPPTRIHRHLTGYRIANPRSQITEITDHRDHRSGSVICATVVCAHRVHRRVEEELGGLLEGSQHEHGLLHVLEAEAVDAEDGATGGHDVGHQLDVPPVDT
jgi:hypothetical protein